MNVANENFCLKICKEVDALLKTGKVTDLTKYNDIQKALAEIRQSVDDGNMKDKERMDAIELKLSRMQTVIGQLQGVPKKRSTKRDKK